MSVEYEINRCPVCGRIYRQKIPFKQKGFRCTQLFYRSVVYMVATCKMTITDVAKTFATNRNLEDMVREGTFREDLFYRLNVVRIRIPPLRERPDDIPVLAQAILAKYAESMGMRIKGFSPEALAALSQHPFYGNVRELENVIERAMIFADSDVIEVRDLDLRQALGRGDGKDTIPVQDAQSLKDIERNAIIRSLHRWEGNRTRSAEELGISRRTLITKIQEYGIDL